MAAAMLPGKAEKRIASSIFITLVPPRRDVATKEKTQRELQPGGAGVPGTHQPQILLSPPQLPNGGEGRPWGLERCGKMVMGLRRLWRCFAEGCACGRGCGGILWGAIPQIPAHIPAGSGSWGWALFALHCRVLIGAVCPSCFDGVCFWGRSASAAAKLLGCYCDRALF